MESSELRLSNLCQCSLLMYIVQKVDDRACGGFQCCEIPRQDRGPSERKGFVRRIETRGPDDKLNEKTSKNYNGG